MARICALSTICFILSLLTTGNAYAAPQMVIEEPFYQAGEVYEGSILAHDFLIKNTGDAPLHFNIAADSDIKISMSQTSLRPGISEKISVRLETDRLRGKLAKLVELSSNDPVTPAATLSILATIKEIITVTPSSVDFGLIHQGTNYYKKIVIGNNIADPIIISQIITSPAEHLFIRDLRYVTLLPGQQKEIILTFKPGNFSGVVEGSLLIRTNYERLREKIVPLRAEVVSNGKRMHILP